MKESILELICNPKTHQPLVLDREYLYDPLTKQKFPIYHGIPALLDQSEITGLNRKYQRMYDGMPFFYDFTQTISKFFYDKGAERVRHEILNELHIKETDRVLDVSIGTGQMLFHAKIKPQFFGIDLSLGMLKKCRRNLKKWHMETELFQANAEALPFRDGIFDAVTHFGGINFFNDKGKAIDEMIRVAKPGATIVISDETLQQVQNAPAIIKRFFEAPNPDTYAPPVQFVPKTMLDLQVKMLRNGDLYLISFRKP
jgi:ubiquinone/menaquinone biosynthesis C-methylase UbiE